MLENPAFRISKMADSGCEPGEGDPRLLAAPPPRSCLHQASARQAPRRSTTAACTRYSASDMERLTQDMSNQSLSAAPPQPVAVRETPADKNEQSLLPASRQRAETQPSPLPPSDGRVLLQKRARRPTEGRLSRNPSLQNLVNDMIEQGVQCNVQASEMPIVASRSSPPAPPSPQNGQDSIMVDTGDWASLEARLGAHYSGSESYSFRRAGSAISCRKVGVPFKSAAEAALQCKNIKRNIPRRRKRPKTTTASECSASPAPVATSS